MNTTPTTMNLANGSRITAVASAAAGAARGLRQPAPVCHVVHTTEDGKGWALLTITDSAFFLAFRPDLEKWLEGQLGFRPANWELICRAFTIRQPWAWGILYAGKPVENRSRRFCSPGWYYIHASAPVPKREYMAAMAFMARLPQVEPPPFEDQSRTHAMTTSALVGVVQITKWVKSSPSPWFVGPAAAELANAIPLTFPIYTSGSQGVFYPHKHLKP